MCCLDYGIMTTFRVTTEPFTYVKIRDQHLKQAQELLETKARDRNWKTKAMFRARSSLLSRLETARTLVGDSVMRRTQKEGENLSTLLKTSSKFSLIRDSKHSEAFQST